MSDIKLVRSHSLPIGKAKAIVQEAADDLAQEYSLTSDWRGNTLHFHRHGVTGHMSVTESEIGLEVTLGLLLKPLKGRLTEHIQQTFDKLLARNKLLTKAPKKAPRRA